MGACASVPKAMRSETATPEPAKEDTTSTAVEAPKLATVEVEAKEEEIVDENKEEIAVEVEAPKEVSEIESEKPEQVVEAPVSSEPEAASNEEEKKTEVVEQN